MLDSPSLPSTALPWLLVALAVIGLALRWTAARSARAASSPRATLAFQDWSAVRLLPLPYEDDRKAVLDLLRDFAPGRELAVYSVGDPPLLVTHRAGENAPGPAQARWIEFHRAALSRGEIVVEPHCGILVPAFTRAGLWRGVVIVVGTDPVRLDEATAADLRLLAATLEHAFLLTAWLHARNVAHLHERLVARTA
jgi:hypothetical protein